MPRIKYIVQITDEETPIGGIFHIWTVRAKIEHGGKHIITSVASGEGRTRIDCHVDYERAINNHGVEMRRNIGRRD